MDENINEYQISEGGEDFLCIKVSEKITTGKTYRTIMLYLYMYKTKTKS